MRILKENCAETNLSGDVGVMFPVPVAVICVDVIGTVGRLKDDAGMIVGNDIRVPILWLIAVHVGMIPGELLARFDRLKRNGSRNFPASEETPRNRDSCLPRTLEKILNCH